MMRQVLVQAATLSLDACIFTPLSLRSADVATPDVAELTVQLIEELAEDNDLWTPQQLQRMSTETFMATTETLRSITDYSSDQLDVLKEKAVEVRKKDGSVDFFNDAVTNCDWFLKATWWQ